MIEKLIEAIVDASFHDWLNFCIALFAMLVAFGAANRMNKETEMTIIGAFVTVGVALAAQAIGVLLPQAWLQAFDTLLIGGIASLLIGTRRRTIWMKPELMPKISATVCVISWLVFFLTI